MASGPFKTREETATALSSLLSGTSRPPHTDVFGQGHNILVSDVPSTVRSDDSGGGVVMGIDEAGRGPVLGPMVYGAAYWRPEDADSIPRGFKDSKQLDVGTRERLFESVKGATAMGFVVRVIHASEISRGMLRAEPYNLNAMSHDAAMQMIRAVLVAGVKIDTCYVDTVGIAASYQSKLEREFRGHDIRFVVEKKADSKYAPCSAASVVAKVSRDAITENWKWSEPCFEPCDGSNVWGSGYPSDPKCKDWIKKNASDPVFGYPDFVRFSWGTAKKMLEDECVEVEWEADQDDEEEGSGVQTSLSTFVVSKSGPRKRPRLQYFEKSGINPVTRLVPM